MSPTPEADKLQRLLSETRWVRGLARRLCLDSARADDLVQEAWVAALEHPPREPRHARTWIARVIANLSHAERRSAAARRAREHVSSRAGATESAVDVVARTELSRRLIEHVLSLDEPSRSTILARYFDDLSAEAIANRGGLSDSPVRTRRRRAPLKRRRT